MPWYTPVLTAAAPSLTAVTSQACGHGPATAYRAMLDRIPQAVVKGFRAAGDAKSITELQERLSQFDPELRGFGYEGATMAFTLLDAAIGGSRTKALLEGPGRPHLFLAYIGIGFAMRRLPRVSWSRVLPDLDAPRYHPVLSWLAVDGLGFDLAYFSRARYVERQRRLRAWPWLGMPGYFRRAIDQGIGRALWFIAGADEQATARLVGRFTESRKADLWSGVALAATFAGPSVHASSYSRLRELAGAYGNELAVGASLASAARVAAGYVPPYSDVAAAVFTGSDTQAAAASAEQAATVSDGLDLPAYELWRENIRATLNFQTLARGRRNRSRFP